MPKRKKIFLLLFDYFKKGLVQKSELSPAYFTAYKCYKVLIMNIHTLCISSTFVYAVKLKEALKTGLWQITDRDNLEWYQFPNFHNAFKNLINLH